MLILEGSDLVGKTTLAKRLLAHPYMQDNAYIYKHFSRLPDSFDFCFDYMRHAVRASVQDRFHMSEIIYSYARNETESPLTPEKYRLVDAYLRTLGSFTVVVTANVDTVTSRWGVKDREEMYQINLIQNCNNHFCDAFKNRRFKQYELDVDWQVNTTMPISDSTINTIVETYIRRQDVITSIKAKEENYRPKREGLLQR